MENISRNDVFIDEGFNESFIDELELRSFKLLNDEAKLRREINTRINFMLQTKFNTLLQEFNDDLIEFKAGYKVYNFTGLYNADDVESEYKEYLQNKVLELLDEKLPNPEFGQNLVVTLNLNSEDANNKTMLNKTNISIKRSLYL